MMFNTNVLDMEPTLTQSSQTRFGDLGACFGSGLGVLFCFVLLGVLFGWFWFWLFVWLVEVSSCCCFIMIWGFFLVFSITFRYLGVLIMFL